MKLQLLIVLTWTLLAVSACVIEPYRGGGRGDYYGGDHGGDRGPHDYGRRVWH